jgi:hypothetical protein
MTPAEAVEILVARTGHARYRQLSDPASPEYRPEYAALALRLVAGEGEVPDPDDEVARRRAGKRRVPLGFDQRRLAPPGCVECAKKAEGRG